MQILTSSELHKARDMKCKKLLFRLLLLVISVSWLPCLPISAFATVEENPEIGQAAQIETTAAASSEPEPEPMTADEPPQESENAVSVVQDEQISIDYEPDESGLEPPGAYEQFEVEYNEGEEHIPYIDYEYETLLTLKSIEYQLKIIAGGTVLAIIGAFIWFTILKPIKRFTSI